MLKRGEKAIMKGQILPLTTISPGRTVILVAITGGLGLRQRLTDMGLKEGVKFRLVHSLRPGPCIVNFGGTRLVLGHGMAQKILVRSVRLGEE